MFFLLPRREGYGGEGGEGGAPAATVGVKGRAPKPTIEYSSVVESVFSRHFASNGGYFTVYDMARLAHLDFPNRGLPDEDKMRPSLLRIISREPLFVSIETSAVPFTVLESLRANHPRPQKWMRKITKEEAAANARGTAGGAAGGDGSAAKSAIPAASAAAVSASISVAAAAAPPSPSIDDDVEMIE